MDYLLDTNACVAMLRNQPPSVRNHADKIIAEGSRLAISSIALHELWYGTFKSTRVDEGVWRLRMFLAGAIQVLPFDEEDARVSGKIRADLTSAGRRIGEYDTLIGGQCLRHGMTLVTNNLSEFSRIKGLNCVDWTH
jgi:tRNA(fMet)-specific endonuclease VapC